MSDTSASKRRWFRYSLRTLFVMMTVFACWLGYELNWIRQRHAVLQDWNASAFTPLFPHTRVSPPGMLGLFGEIGYGCLWKESQTPLTNQEEGKLASVRRMFPEATVSWFVEP